MPPLLLAEIVFPGWDPVAVHLGPLAVRWYGLGYLAGFLIAGWLLDRLSRDRFLPLTTAAVSDLIGWLVVGVIAGGRLARSVLSPGVLVDAHAEIEECILMNDVVVGAGAHLRRAIVDKQVVIPPGSRVGWDLPSDRRKFTVTDSGLVVIPKGVPRTEEFWRA